MADLPTEAPAPEPPAALLPALRAFDRGDFRTASALVAPLVKSEDTEVAAAAKVLAARLAPDPWAIRFGLLAITLLALVAGLFAH